MSIRTKFTKMAAYVISKTLPKRDINYKSLDRRVTAHQLRQLVHRLDRLHIDHNPRVGVCTHLLETVENGDWIATSTILRYAAITWEHRSGCDAFPIPSEDSQISPADEYTRCVKTGSMYIGRQGELRRMYAEYIIKICENMLEGYEPGYRGL